MILVEAEEEIPSRTDESETVSRRTGLFSGYSPALSRDTRAWTRLIVVHLPMSVLYPKGKLSTSESLPFIEVSDILGESKVAACDRCGFRFSSRENETLDVVTNQYYKDYVVSLGATGQRSS